ncbi:phosphate ABC transporter substrate-binding protein PstS [Boudabousia liubingyangii]|uniref:Phosphate-binding protein n=1 Tax=Boudabousia liubingyangii TaxID=1921764 RepID=A0A1Q5PK12_9ACTO|nr:phosphate ABC transporter substrate-binding protein PstS [Boudabousia liubingyangii]OKL46564.1 phosphate ABC transporter substrate-binding protein PstS [Boudabousia liubingyangii]OKL46851.1 phosphate ABC transporter substrate-binding protein PstS [Boudabousia liubingyangii]
MKNLKHTRRIAGAAIIALSMTLAACGSDNPTGTESGNKSAEGGSSAPAELSGTLAGAGASSQKAAIAAWKAGFEQEQKGAKVEYDPVGSGSGVKKFLAKEVSFAGSDEVLKEKDQAAAEERCGSPALHIPVYISPIAVVFNLDGVEKLNLSAPVIAKIFAGKITKWNDPAIAAENAGVALPDLDITPVHRADGSGTTYNFTQWMHAAAPEDWTNEANKKWPLEGTNGEKTQGVVDLVKNGKGSIGYVDDSAAGTLGIVQVKGSGDQYVAPNAEGAAKTLDESELAGKSDLDLAFKINRTPKAADAYPLILVSYDVVCSTYPDDNTAKLVKAFVSYETSEAGQNAAAQAAKSAPLSANLREKIAKSLDSIKVK